MDLLHAFFTSIWYDLHTSSIVCSIYIAYTRNQYARYIYDPCRSPCVYIYMYACMCAHTHYRVVLRVCVCVCIPCTGGQVDRSMHAACQTCLSFWTRQSPFLAQPRSPRSSDSTTSTCMQYCILRYSILLIMYVYATYYHAYIHRISSFHSHVSHSINEIKSHLSLKGQYR